MEKLFLYIFWTPVCNKCYSWFWIIETSDNVVKILLVQSVKNIRKIVEKLHIHVYVHQQCQLHTYTYNKMRVILFSICNCAWQTTKDVRFKDNKRCNSWITFLLWMSNKQKRSMIYSFELCRSDFDDKYIIICISIVNVFLKPRQTCQ